MTNPGCPSNLRWSARERPERASDVEARDQPWLPLQPPLVSQGKAQRASDVEARDQPWLPLQPPLVSQGKAQ